MLFAILTFLFGEGDMQKGYLNLNFLIGFGLEKIATDAAKLIKDLSSKYKNTNWSFEYSPESFTGTELDYAVEVCDEVVDI